MFEKTILLIIKLFLFMIIGFFLTKKKILPADAPKSLSILLVWLCCPALTLKTFASQITPKTLADSFWIILLSGLSLLISFLLSIFIGKTLIRNQYTRNVLTYSLCVPNYGYFGTVLIMALLGEKVLAEYQLFVLPVSVFVATAGYVLLLDRKNNYRDLLNPILISTILGIIIGVFGLPVPTLIMDAMSDFSACIGPVSMILAGCIIAEYNPKRILASRDVFIIVGAKMLLVPLIAVACGRIFGLPHDYYFILIAFHCLPAGLNSVVFPSTIGKDSSIAAGVAVLSNIIAVITVPLFFVMATR